MNIYAIPGLAHEIEHAVSDVWGVPAENIPQRTRKREIVEARQVCMWWRAQHTGESYNRIGERLGGFDHATVLHARRTVDNLIETNRIFRDRVARVDNMMRTKQNRINNTKINDESNTEI